MTTGVDKGNREPEAGDLHTLALFLDEHEGSIVAAWITAVLDQLGKYNLNRSDVENAIRHFLRHVSQQLRRGGTKQTESPHEHGEQRFRVGYELAEMLKEYGLLLDVIERVAAENEVSLTASSFAALARNVVTGSAQAVLAFVKEERHAADQLARRRMAFLAHELRGPLQNVALGLEAWAAGADPDAIRGALERSVVSLRSLVDEELLRAQASARVQPVPRPEPFDFAALVNEILDATMAFAHAKDISLEYRGVESLPVELDRLMLWSVVTNLVRNGVKFSRKGGSVIASVDKKQDRLHLAVEDACGGLPENLMTKIFEDFEKAGSDRSGFGLGLGIARQAIVAHGGTIAVSNRGNGCVFACVLPLIVAAKPGEGSPGS